MRSVFSGRPMVTNELEQLGRAILLGRGAGAVKAVFLEFLDDLALAQPFLLPPHGDELPATAQPRLFGAKTDSLEAPADQAPMLLVPARIVFTGEKNSLGSRIAILTSHSQNQPIACLPSGIGCVFIDQMRTDNSQISVQRIEPNSLIHVFVFSSQSATSAFVSKALGHVITVATGLSVEDISRSQRLTFIISRLLGHSSRNKVNYRHME